MVMFKRYRMLKRNYILLLLILVSSLVFVGCGGSGGSSPAANDAISDITSAPAAVPVAPPGTGASTVADDIALSSSLPQGGQLSPGGELTIFAVVTNAGDAVADGTLVSFTTDKGSITASDTSTSGSALATFQSGSAVGTVTITATSGTVISQISIEVAAGTPTSIITENVAPGTIGVTGAGIEDTSQIIFDVRDSGGGPAPDGTAVNFSIQTPVGGGESLSATSALSAGGKVTVAFQSGTVPGTVTILASLTLGNGSTISTEARVTIVSNRPDAGRLTMAASTLNLAGGMHLGLQSTISAFLGDRAGNVVPDGTPVSFISECGTIGESSGFNTTTTFGQASAVFQTSAPTVPNLDGIAPAGNVGLCRIVAFTPGRGTFIDFNGNGTFDQGIDNCLTVMDEPYIDANDSSSHEVGEFFIDANQNGDFDTNVVNCVDDTMVWDSMNLLISDFVGSINLAPTTFIIAQNNSLPFTIDFEDMWGNALAAGTTLQVTTTAGDLTGVTSITQADTIGGGSSFNFSLHSDGATSTLAEVKVTISPAASENNNGAEVFTLAVGTINN